MSYLKVFGTKIVDGDGKDVVLKGAGLGGWMKWVVMLSAHSCILIFLPLIAWRTSFLDIQAVNSRSVLLLPKS
jgi:hypothetical protein